MNFVSHIKHKKAVVFGFDNVLYPEKDYLLQVYYLFAEFLAYIEHFDATAITTYMQQEYVQHGAENLFEKTATHFNIPIKYQENFLLLHQNARLPLKLLLYQQSLNFLQDTVSAQKEVLLLVDGNPVEQLNKIKQIEWHGLETHLRLYFSAEFTTKAETLAFMLTQHQLDKSSILWVGHTDIDEDFTTQHQIDYFKI